MFDLGRTLLASAARMPDAIAITDGSFSRTYGEWRDDVLRIVSGFDALGLKPGDHMVTVLQNCHQAATLHMACQMAGLIITPINWRATADELTYVLNDSMATVVVYQNETVATVAGADNASSIIRIGVETEDEASSTWDQLIKRTPAAAAPRVSISDTSVMLYTSGTTGRGKGVPRTHGAERAAAMAHVAQNLYTRGDVTLGVMPLYHTMGVRSLLASVIINGCFVCQRHFDANVALELIQRHRITNLYLVPTLYHDLLSAEQFETADVSSVRKLGFAGQSMTDGLLKRTNAAFQPDLFVNHYGSSEIYTFTTEPNAVAKPSSAGKAGLNQEIRVIRLNSTDPEDIVAEGEEGQIIAVLDSDEAFTGYWKRPDADEKALHAGWYFTGDIGFQDGDGDLYVTGRVDDMMISGGENILPAEVESVLSLHDAVLEVAVAGMPHPRWGQQVTAFIVRHTPVDAETLDQWCLDSDLAPFKRPRAYVFIKAVPKSPVGKILRRMLVSGEYKTDN
jgi:2-furoate---CoA ligase